MKNIYDRKSRWKIWLLIGGTLIVVASLWYTNFLAGRIADEEKKKVRIWAEALENRASLLRITNRLFEKMQEEELDKVKLWANATRRLIESPEDDIDPFLFELIANNETVPVILTDENDQVISMRNVDDPEFQKISILTESLKAAFTGYPRIVEESAGGIRFLYYRDSKLFSDLKGTLSDLIHSFFTEVVVNSASVPVILADTKERVIAFGNIDTLRYNRSRGFERLLKKMKEENEPIAIDLGNEDTRMVYYRDSYLLKQIRYYPFIQLGIIGIFLLVAYYAFSTARSVEQNQVWVGMAKETAHQLGTPITSLLAWVEYLRESGLKPELVAEMEKDVGRLEQITDRFSKIGSAPDLRIASLAELIIQSVGYLSVRKSKKVELDVQIPEQDSFPMMLSQPLFHWVIENLVKNGLDAMNGEGTITISLSRSRDKVVLDVSDTGKGIPKSKVKTIFEPGFSTKRRGWGLGLSLSRRIVETYHGGRIFVLRSAPGKGTTFRIVLPAPLKI